MNEKAPLIEVKNVSKYFPMIGQVHQLKSQDRFTIVRNLFASRDKAYNHQALDDISFDVYPGEAVGIIGRNGSGKSTLLRIMTGILQPSSGNAVVKGTYGELFSLNSGFHMKLTGRQNIYLYGALKGIPKNVIEEREDEIIKFSGIGRYIDEPMKTYSSGMRGRLGFSLVIINLPNILFIDEALSTGDKRFRMKCNQKFAEWLETGERTLILVSHSENAIRDICNRVIWLHEGKILMDGEPDTVLSAYEEYNESLEQDININNF